MIDMTFASFLTILVISVIVALIMHYGIAYRALNGIDGFFAKWVTGWLGAWVASPVLGHWFSGVKISAVYIIPAFLGAFMGSFLFTAWGKAMAMRPRALDLHETSKAA